MLGKTKLPATCGHVAVLLEHNILVISGHREEYPLKSNREIWRYNLYTEQWKRHVIPDKDRAPPQTYFACAVTIGKDVYMFGGKTTEQDVYIFGGETRWKKTNALWKLAGTLEKHFAWNSVPIRNSMLPSPRERHSGWEYAGKLWVFGGFADQTQNRYLHDHGDFEDLRNNQLLYFDPYSKVWTNPQCFGAIPPPDGMNACTISGDTVCLFNPFCCELYQLDMCSFVWTQFETTPKPERRKRPFCTLTSITSSRLVFHGGIFPGPSKLKNTQVVDLPTQTLSNYTSNMDHNRGYHTGTIGLNNDLIIIGGTTYDDPVTYNITFHVMFEPKSLQQLAMQTLYTYRTVLPWTSLPNKLIARLEISDHEADTALVRPCTHIKKAIKRLQH